MTSDLIKGPELAAILKVSRQTLWRMTKLNPRLAACAVTSGYKRPRYRYSRRLLIQAGIVSAESGPVNP